MCNFVILVNWHFNIHVLIDCFFVFCCCCSQEEQEGSSSIQPHTESDESKSEPLTVIEQPEVTTPQPTANQAMKGTFMLHVSLIYMRLIQMDTYSLID